MTPALKALGYERLTLDEKIELFEEIRDDLVAVLDSEAIPQSHRELLDERIAAHERDPHAGFTWEEVQDKIREMLGEPR